MKTRRIVIIHGWGANTTKLAPLARQLRKSGWVVFLPKLPGFDASPPSHDWGVGEYAQRVLEKTGKRFLGKKFFVFGHSFGGRIAIKLAAVRNPELLGVILCAAGGISRASIVKRLIFAALAAAGRLLLVGTTLVWWRRLLYKLAREHDYEKASERMKEVFRKIIVEDLKPAVYSIKAPMLVLWGDKDNMTPVNDAYWIQQANKRSKLVVFENEGHKLPYTQPSKIAKEITTWAKNIRC